MSDNIKIKMEDAIKLLWEEYKLRYSNYWGSFNRYSLAILTITVIPYIKPDNVKPLEELVIAFPVIAILLTIICSWLLGAEYQRLDMVRKKYDNLLTKKYRPVRLPKKTFIERLFAKRIGTRTTLVFFFGFLLISLINFFVLLKVFNITLINQ
jgi:hypothetical protein